MTTNTNTIDASAYLWSGEDHDGDHSCVCCGRETKTGRDGLRAFVQVVGGGTHLAGPNDVSFEDDPGAMGWFPIGPHCKGKLTRLGVPASWFVRR